METIRGDFDSIKHLIVKLINIGKAFEKNDDDWSHLKNNEDWDRSIFDIADDLKRAKVELIYSEGRDMALAISDDLISINTNFHSYPDITSVVDTLSGWKENKFIQVLEEAQKIKNDSKVNSWALNRMMTLFENQLKLIDKVVSTIEQIKNSDIYKQENGQVNMNDEPSKNTFHTTINGNVGQYAAGNRDVCQTQNVGDNTEIFDKIIEDLKNINNSSNTDPVCQKVEEMREALGTFLFKERYAEFTALLSSHITILGPVLAPYIENLAKMIS